MELEPLAGEDEQRRLADVQDRVAECARGTWPRTGCVTTKAGSWPGWPRRRNVSARASRYCASSSVSHRHARFWPSRRWLRRNAVITSSSAASAMRAGPARSKGIGRAGKAGDVHGLLGDVHGVVAELFQVRGPPARCRAAGRARGLPAARRRCARSTSPRCSRGGCRPGRPCRSPSRPAATSFWKKAVMAETSCDWTSRAISTRSSPSSSSIMVRHRPRERPDFEWAGGASGPSGADGHAKLGGPTPFARFQPSSRRDLPLVLLLVHPDIQLEIRRGRKPQRALAGFQADFTALETHGQRAEVLGNLLR